MSKIFSGISMYDRFKDPKHIEWAKAVKIRDHYRCVICEKSDVFLHSHHLNSWNKFPEQRFLLENGVVLCASDHGLFHKIAGYGNNTKSQFQEFQEMMRLLREIAKVEVIKKVEKSK